MEIKQQKDAYFADLARRSQERAQAAEVELTFTVIPEPSSVCLIVAGIGLMMRRRNG